MSQGLRWVLDIDIEKYFDSIPHGGVAGVVGIRLA
jgi:hypothetical protein